VATKKTRAGASVSGLLDRIAELEKRVLKLEAERDAAVVAAARAPAPVSAAKAAESAAISSVTDPGPAKIAPPAAAAPSGPKEETTEEILMVISAAVAAFLGKRAHVRQIRMIGSAAWAEQGRVSIMASHRWAMQRG